MKAKKVIKKILGKPEKIVCVGLGKTGTTSFSDAMKILGYRHKSMGFHHAYQHRRMLPIRLAIARHQSFDDFPWCYLYEYIEQRYPNSKFVLTRRKSAEAWYQSLVKHHLRGESVHNDKLFYGYHSPMQNPKHFVQLYESHNERVRQYFRGDPRFLEVCWEDGDGWDELCGFLGRRTPKENFPHSNKGSEIDYEAAIEASRERVQSALI